MAQPTVIILDNIDIYELGKVDKLAQINEKKTFKKDKLISNDYSFTVTNEDDFFSVNSPKSVFSGIDWLYSNIKATDTRGESVWDGVITNIMRNHETKKAIIKTRNSLFQLRNEIIDYQSEDWETGAQALINIASQIGFTDLDGPSISKSNTQLQANNSFLKANFNRSDNTTFQQVIEKLAEYTNSDAYSHLGKIYFKHFQPNQSGASVFLKPKELKTTPTVVDDEKEVINQFSINYFDDNESPATDTNSDNLGELSRSRLGVKSLPEMRSNKGQLIYRDKPSAVYIGNGYIRKTQKGLSTIPSPLSRISFSLYIDNRNWIDLNTIFGLTLPDEGWIDKLFEVFEFTIDEDSDNVSVVAYEVV